nr:uncharacterized protein LOC108169718 [Malus domestica]
MVADSLEKWHEKLRDALWAYRTSKWVGTGTTLYALTFGQDVILPMEINIEDLDATQILALNKIQEGKKVVAQAYNKIVKLKAFNEGELVWKTVLPLGAQVRGFGKWSPTWADPFIINQVFDR